MTEEIQSIGLPTYEYRDRDVSWLMFNYRVLQEAKDPNVPLVERIKFLAIYSSNLGEFFRIRVAHHRNLKRLGKKTKSRLDYDPNALLLELYKIVNQHLTEFSQIFEEQIIPELKNHSIYLLNENELTKEQERFIETYFKENMLPYVQPVLLVQNRIQPFLNNSELYLTIALKPRLEVDEPEEPVQYAIVKIPSDHLPRFIELPSVANRHDIILLDDVVRNSLGLLFPGYHILSSYSIKLTRDAELYIEDEFSGDLLDKIKKSLVKRNVGPASRLVYDQAMPQEMLDYFLRLLSIRRNDLTHEGRYHNNFDFFNFPDFKKKELRNRQLKPLAYKALQQKAGDYFKQIEERDHLLYFPYQEYEPVIKFFEEASQDPYVTQIKITQYRVAKKSRIMNALIEAASRGISVFVFIEVKARFDEEANLAWGEEMEKHGIKVKYSFPGLKVHAKCALVSRKEDGDLKHYAYLSTGNFHEQTAKVYADFGLFTSDERITSELNRFFGFLENMKLPTASFKHLLVAQFNFNDKIKELIEFEKQQALEGKKAEIVLKLNSIQDKEMIDLLYDASQCGVKIKMIVRGICSLIPKRAGMSENIEGISIVDRYLEHSRSYYFYHGGEELIYLSSADWMVRNLHFRIEVAFPIYDERLKKILLDITDLQWSDNVKSRSINDGEMNEYRETETRRKLQSQLETYKYLKESQ
ncbi:MAG TPA: polyphosphate kinase 1 [Saprospiraceae bacterium]|nr:polyphosphate kinase 1 [Saprospiraceae bacterium]